MKPAIGIAPGSLDFLGGVADYSGSLVLQMPLSLTNRVAIRERAEPGVEFRSVQMGELTVPSDRTADSSVPESAAADRAEQSWFFSTSISCPNSNPWCDA